MFHLLCPFVVEKYNLTVLYVFWCTVQRSDFNAIFHASIPVVIV